MYIHSQSKQDRTIAVWDMRASHDIVLRRVLVGHRAAVNVVDFDDKYIVSASGDRTIKVRRALHDPHAHTITVYVYTLHTCIHVYYSVCVYIAHMCIHVYYSVCIYTAHMCRCGEHRPVSLCGLCTATVEALRVCSTEATTSSVGPLTTPSGEADNHQYLWSIHLYIYIYIYIYTCRYALPAPIPVVV